MDAFERFLTVYPDWRGQVTYLQITPKSRSEIQEYAEMERTISEAAGRINGAYGEIAWTPIVTSIAPTAAACSQACFAPRAPGSSPRCATA